MEAADLMESTEEVSMVIAATKGANRIKGSLIVAETNRMGRERVMDV